MTPSLVVWFTGLPSSGKSALARRVRDALRDRGTPCVLLDGDELRETLVPRPGYDERSRDDFYATLAGLAALQARQGQVVLVAATAHLRAFRTRARSLAPQFIEVAVAVPPEEARRRDAAKGLYARTQAAGDQALPGQGLAYEPPEAPEVTATGSLDDRAVAEVVRRVEAAPLRDVYVALALRPSEAARTEQNALCARLSLAPRKEQHLTLAYLGSAPAAEVRAWGQALRGLGPVPAEVLLAGTGGLARLGEAELPATEAELARADAHRVAWWAVEPSPALLALRQQVLERLGRAPSEAGYWPHVTVGSATPGAEGGGFWDAYGVPKLASLGRLHCPERLSVERAHLTCPAYHPASLVTLG